MRSRFVRAAVVLLLVATAVGCSLLPKKLDMGGLETELASDANAILQTTGITVSCPDNVKAEAGNQFDCTATVATGETFTIRVTQKDSDGNVTFVLQDAPTPSPSPST
jgi:Domain of unknown function (DUF4333)